jgi:hypothetical protein
VILIGKVKALSLELVVKTEDYKDLPLELLEKTLNIMMLCIRLIWRVLEIQDNIEMDSSVAQEENQEGYRPYT